MTVKVMAGETAVHTGTIRVPEPYADVKEDTKAGQAAEKPTVYTPEQEVYIPRYKTSRRRGSFGSVLFMQLLLSALFAFGLWAGCVFGSGDIREVCVRITELFR